MQKRSNLNISNEYLINLEAVLGKGSTGIVCEGVNLRKKNEKVAVKIIDLKTIDNQVTEYLLRMEKLALASLKNENILRCLKIVQNKKYCFMVTEYCNGGTLKDYIKQSNSLGYLTEEESFKIVRCLLEGYYQLVQKRIVHRDLKPANIMMHNGLPKIIDFGYCQIFGHQKPTLEYNVGSPSYMAPESYKMSLYNEKTEIWAIGVILFQCLTGRTIDQGRQMIVAYKQIRESGVPYPKHVSQKARKLIDWCLRLNPSHRPSCKELLQSNFFNSNQLLLKPVDNRPQNLQIVQQRTARPQSQYEKPRSALISSQQGKNLINSKHCSPNIECFQEQNNFKKVRINCQNQQQRIYNPYEKSHHLTDRTQKNICNTIHNKIGNNRKDGYRVYSKYEDNRFKPINIANMTERPQPYSTNRDNQPTLQREDKKFAMYRTQKIVSMKLPKKNEQKQNTRAPYQYNPSIGNLSKQQFIPTKKFSINVPKTENSQKNGFKYEYHKYSDLGKNRQFKFDNNNPFRM